MSDTQAQISNLQRAALRGTEAIAAAIDFDEADPERSSTERLEVLITKCYTWGTALESLTLHPLQSTSQPVVSAQSPTYMKAPNPNLRELGKLFGG